MRIEQYRDYLDACTAQEGMGASVLLPVQSTQILDVETQLGGNLPEQYETFLTQIGVGEECGGVGLWFHLDITSPGNVLEASEQVARSGTAMLVVYDAYDGELYGFLPAAKGFQPEVHAWTSETGEMRLVADQLEDFLDVLADESADAPSDEELGFSQS